MDDYGGYELYYYDQLIEENYIEYGEWLDMLDADREAIRQLEEEEESETDDNH